MTTCRICFKIGANGHCVQCKLISCETCYQLHLKECSNLIEFKYHLCQKHGNQLEGYCCQCYQMTCGMCSNDHLGHNIIPTKLAMDNIARDLINISRDMHDKEVQMNNSTANIRRMKCDIENKIENEERKWQSSLFNIKRHLLSEINKDLKHDSQLQLQELLNKAKVNLDSLKKGCFPFTFLSKWAHVRSVMHLFEKLLRQRIEDIAHFEKWTTSDFSQIYRSHMIHEEDRKEAHKLSEKLRYLQTENEMETIRNLSGTSVDRPCNKEIDNLATLFEGASMGEKTNWTNGNSKTQDEIIDGGFVNIDHRQVPVAENMFRYHEAETIIQKLTEQLRHLQADNENMRQMIRMQTEEKSYINKVCLDMVKVTTEIPSMSFEDINIPTTENATINTLEQTMKLILNRLVEIKNKLIDTEQQLIQKCVSIANWTDSQRHEREQDLKTLKEKESKIIQYDKELKIRSDRITELQTSNGILAQQNFDNQKGYAQLQAELHSLKQENAVLTLRILKFTSNPEDTEILRNSIETLKIHIMEKERYILALRSEKDDLHTRLSSVAGDKLTKGNPEITDLGDPNRPMKISEKYGELYDNEWTDAMECTEDVKLLFKDLPIADIEEILVHHLYKLLKCCYVECLLLSQEQLHIIGTAIVETLRLESQDDQAVSSILGCKDINILRRKNGDKYAMFLIGNQAIANKIIESLTSRWDYIHKNEHLMRKLTMTSFFQKCVQLCWLMAIQDPVLYLSDDIIPDTVFDKNIYREYVQSGNKARYAVWPALFLHKNGPLLFKGVVQAYS